MARGNALRRLAVFMMESIYEEMNAKQGRWNPETLRDGLRQILSSRSSDLGRPLDTIVIKSVFPSRVTAEQAVDGWVQWVLEKPVSIKSKTGLSSIHALFLALCQSGTDPRWRDSRIERSGDACHSCLVPEFLSVSKRLDELCGGSDSTLRLHLAGGAAIVPTNMSVWDALYAAPRHRGNIDDRRSVYEISSLLRALETAQDIWRHIAALGLYPPDWAREFDHDEHGNSLSRHEANILRSLQLRLISVSDSDHVDPAALAGVWNALAREQEHDKNEKKRNWRRLPAGFDTPEAFATSEIGQAMLSATSRVREVALPVQPTDALIDAETPEQLLLEGPEQIRRYVDLLVQSGEIDDVEERIVRGVLLDGLEIAHLILEKEVVERFGTEKNLAEAIESLVERILASPLH